MLVSEMLLAATLALSSCSTVTINAHSEGYTEQYESINVIEKEFGSKAYGYTTATLVVNYNPTVCEMQVGYNKIKVFISKELTGCFKNLVTKHERQHARIYQHFPKQYWPKIVKLEEVYSTVMIFVHMSNRYQSQLDVGLDELAENSCPGEIKIYQNRFK